MDKKTKMKIYGEIGYFHSLKVFPNKIFIEKQNKTKHSDFTMVKTAGYLDHLNYLS